MMLFPFHQTVVPMPENKTLNSDPVGGVSASYDLLSLPGMVISVLHDGTTTASPGGDAGCVSTHWEVGHPVRGSAPPCVSAGTTDSSILMPGLADDMRQDGGSASQFRIPFRQPAMTDLVALVLLLVAAGLDAPQNDALEEAPAE